MRDNSELIIERLDCSNLNRAKSCCTCFREMTETQNSIQSFLENKNNILISAELHGTPVGQIIAYLLPRLDERPPQLFLYSIDVVEKQREKGVGSSLINFFLNLARELNCNKCFVITNRSNKIARKLYRKSGARSPFDDDLLMTWQIE